ncbi:MAG: chromosome partitioning ATPase, partial [Gemmatimonas sp.]
MSLIEQAAKRLEELRRSGAVAGADAPSGASPNVARSGDDRVPTPEAMVRALDARHVEPATATSLTSRTADTRLASGSDDATAARTARPPIEVDLDRLKARGFVTPDAPKSQIADEFRVIKRPILRNARGKQGGVRIGTLVMVTSALPGEGKTFTSLNLAISMAMEVDTRVLLVDGDVAHPTFPELLGVPASPGLLDLLTNTDLDVGDALFKTNIEKLTVMPAGSHHRRATELLASQQMVTLLS